MWAMTIVFGAVVWLIAALIQAALLQASFKIVTKDTPPFGGTYKLCLVATLVIILVNLGLTKTEIEPALLQILGICISFTVFTFLIKVFGDMALTQAFLVSMVMTGLMWLMDLIVTPLLEGHLEGMPTG